MYDPKPEDHFSFGSWTIGNAGRDPFVELVRRALSPVEIVRLLAGGGVWVINFHVALTTITAHAMKSRLYNRVEFGDHAKPYRRLDQCMIEFSLGTEDRL